MSGRLAFRQWLRETLRGTRKGLVMSSATVIGEMIMNMIPLFLFLLEYFKSKGSHKSSKNTIEFEGNRIFKWTFHPVKRYQREPHLTPLFFPHLFFFFCSSR